MGRLHIKSSKGTLLETDLAGAYSNFVELDGIQIHYEFAKGKNQKNLLVLLHGFGANTFSYRKILKQLSVYGDVLSYDRPCFGLTVRPKTWQGTNPYSYKAQLEILGNLIDHFGKNKQVILFGHSAGAAIAAEWAYANKARVKALVFEDPAILTVPPVSPCLSKVVKTKPFDYLGPRLVAGFKKAGTKILYKSWFDQKGITKEVLDGYYLPLEIKGWEAAFWEFMRSGNQATIQKNLNKLKTPVLVITGDHDEIVPVKDSVEVAKRLPKSQLVKVENCGHIPHEEKPEEFLSAVKGFISQL